MRPDEIVALFGRNNCSILRNRLSTWRSANSSVTSSPIIDINKLLGNSSPAQTAVSLVSIEGPSGEPLHYHVSHLLGIVIAGQGRLRVEGHETEEDEIEVSKGDVAIIPKGILHCFECNSSTVLEYIALEVSDTTIDYQKHHLDHSV